MGCRGTILLLVSVLATSARASRSLLYNSDCDDGDFSCNCAGAPYGQYAEPRVGCDSYYVCQPGRIGYQRCPPTYYFNNAKQKCEHVETRSETTCKGWRDDLPPPCNLSPPDASSSPCISPSTDASTPPTTSPSPATFPSPTTSFPPDAPSSPTTSFPPDAPSSPTTPLPPDAPSSPDPSPSAGPSSSLDPSPSAEPSSSLDPSPSAEASSSLDPLPYRSPSPPSSPDMPSSPKNPAFSYAVYLESSTDPRVKTAADSSIAKLPKYVTHLVLSHMQPDSQYNGGVTFEKTGLYFRSDPAVVKDAIALLKEKNPNTKVLLSVGGFDYDNWEDFNAAAVVEFVHTFGLDGVDIDYEPSTADCSLNQGRMQCDTDEEYIGVIRSLRAALPRPNILTNAVMHVGAYGEGKWAGLEPVSQYTGLSINPLRKAGDDLDTIMLMSYDAGELYQPMLALDACAEYFRRDILLGVEAGPESWGARVLSNTTIDSLTHDVSQRNTAGMMLWHAYKPVDPGTPTSNQISERICSNLNLEDCSSPLVPE